jgi:predicted nucleic acid-binding protein
VKHYILDTFALIAYIADEPGADIVEKIFYDAGRNEISVGMSVVNLGEFYYSSWKKFGLQKANALLDFCKDLPITNYTADEAFAILAGSYKATNAISYADAFAAAAAKHYSGILVTGDPEFKALEKEFHIHWLPSKPKTKKNRK